MRDMGAAEEHIPSSEASFFFGCQHLTAFQTLRLGGSFKQGLALLSLTDVFREEHNKEWSDQVIDALHIAAGWVSNGPDKQDSFKDLGEKEGKQVPALAVHKGEAEKQNC